MLTSRLNSCARKSRRRPTAPPARAARAPRLMRGSRSSSSRMSALVASSTASWCRRSGSSAGCGIQQRGHARRVFRGSPPGCRAGEASAAAVSALDLGRGARASTAPIARPRAARHRQAAARESRSARSRVAKPPALASSSALFEVSRTPRMAENAVQGRRRGGCAADGVHRRDHSQARLVDATATAPASRLHGQRRLDVAAGEGRRGCVARRRLEGSKPGGRRRRTSRPLPLTLRPPTTSDGRRRPVGAGKAGHAGQRHHQAGPCHSRAEGPIA